ncbi:MAG: sulfatase-like hydrolase/transferase, partial [Planctomycetes bacterium]|nr:sulfatase-like hydrolase/transferase [Planctomycetota bacterium]
MTVGRLDMFSASRVCRTMQLSGWVAVGTVAILILAVGACRKDGPPDPATPAPKPKAQPNIVFIFADDLRFDFLGCTGHPFVQTPHLDRLAREGALFENAFVITSLCGPSRATVMTGMYTHLTGVHYNRADMDYDRVTILPQVLKANGYATAFMGKWHLAPRGDGALESSHSRPRPGFDRWICFHDARGHGKYFDCMMNVDGTLHQTRGYVTDVLTDYAVEWIKNQRTPFFLMVSLKNCHMPLKAPPRHERLYTDESVRIPVSLSDDPALLPRAIPGGATRRIDNLFAEIDSGPVDADAVRIFHRK